jgi:hypothetical protein
MALWGGTLPKIIALMMRTSASRNGFARCSAFARRAGRASYHYARRHRVALLMPICGQPCLAQKREARTLRNALLDLGYWACCRLFVPIYAWSR